MTDSTPPPVLAVVHVFHLDVWQRLAPGLAGTPLLITCPEGHGIPAAIRATRPDAQFFECPNRGRDWLPFLEALRAHPVAPDTVLIKLHTKKSPQVKDAERWREGLVHPLASSPAQIQHIQERFSADPTLGVLAPNGHLLRLEKYIAENRPWLEHLSGEKDLDDWLFPAGSMFAARRSALDSIFALDLAPERFAPEPLGIDGHLPHAIERMVGWSAQQSGLRLDVVDVADHEKATQPATTDIDPRYEDWDGELILREENSKTFNLFVCPAETSALTLTRFILAVKREVHLHHIFLPSKFASLTKKLQAIFQNSTFHVSDQPGLREVKQFLQDQTTSPHPPITILAPSSRRWIKRIHRLGLALSEPVGQEVWFGRAQRKTTAPEWAAIERYVVEDLGMRWDLAQVSVPNSGDIGLSKRMTQVWLDSPRMNSEMEERILLGVIARLRAPGEPKSIERLKQLTDEDEGN